MRFPVSQYVFRAIFALAFCLLCDLSPARGAFTEERSTWLNVGLNAISASLADFDNDGDLDLMFQGLNTASQKLYRNNTIGTGAHTFTDVGLSIWPAPVVSATWSAAWADYDGDGRVDVFVGQNNTNQPNGRLMRNTPDGFVDVSVATGLNDNGFAQNVGWADVNNDHRLDMVIGMEGPKVNQIYLQDATHHFAPVAAESGIQSPVANKAYGMAMGDADGDGDVDIFISTCSGDGNGAIAKAYYRNNFVQSGASRTLSFTDVSYTNGTQNISQGYGAEFADFDNDGKLDLWVVGSDTRPTKIYKNMGSGQFVDVDSITGQTILGLTTGGQPNTGFDLNGGKAIDYDNDGKLDLYFHDHGAGGSTPNVKLFHNESNPNAANPADRWKFVDVTASQGFNSNTGIGGYDSVWGDIDLDGDVDMINTTSTSNNERFFINDASTNGNHWLYVKLHGPDWNTTGVGSSLYATLNSGAPGQVTLRREANTNAGTFNQSDLPVQFGLGASASVDKLLIRWPDGTAQVLSNVAANQYLSVTYFPGDYNGDSIVDTRDYIVWQKGLGADFTASDYQTWRSHFGAALAGSGATVAPQVPEPAAITMFGFGLLAFLFSRRR